MRILKNKEFDRWAGKEHLNDEAILKAAEEMEKGLYEANLGRNVYKKRVSIGNRGKRGGARTIVAFKIHNKAIFMYGFAKNQKENISSKEEKALKELAKVFLNFNDNQVDKAIQVGELIEVKL